MHPCVSSQIQRDHRGQVTATNRHFNQQAMRRARWQNTDGPASLGSVQRGSAAHTGLNACGIMCSLRCLSKRTRSMRWAETRSIYAAVRRSVTSPAAYNSLGETGQAQEWRRVNCAADFHCTGSPHAWQLHLVVQPRAVGYQTRGA